MRPRPQRTNSAGKGSTSDTTACWPARRRPTSFWSSRATSSPAATISRTSGTTRCTRWRSILSAVSKRGARGTGPRAGARPRPDEAVRSAASPSGDSRAARHHADHLSRIPPPSRRHGLGQSRRPGGAESRARPGLQTSLGPRSPHLGSVPRLHGESVPREPRDLHRHAPAGRRRDRALASRHAGVVHAGDVCRAGRGHAPGSSRGGDAELCGRYGRPRTLDRGGGHPHVFVDALWHIILPATVVATVCLGYVTRIMRASMLEALSEDYVRTARAKGLTTWAIVMRHALRNSLIPVITIGGTLYAQIMSGTVMAETIYSWPGIGRYAFTSAASLDFPAVMGVALMIGLMYVAVNLCVDTLYVLINPRVRYA